MFDDDGEDIAVNQLMGKAHPLAAVLDGFSPDPGIPEPAHESRWSSNTDRLDRAPRPDDQRLFEIGVATLGLEIDPHEPEAVIDGILELFHVIPGMGGDHEGGRSEPVRNIVLDPKVGLLVDEVDLVDGNERRHIDPVFLDRIDEVFLGRVAADQHLRVHHLALGEDRPHVLDVKIERPDR